MSVRTLVKSAAEMILGHPLIARPEASRGGHTSVILAYHNIVPGAGGEAGDRSLHLGFDSFRRQLDLLSRRLQLRSLDEILADSMEGPAVAITFDDAYESSCRLALPELEQRQIPSTVFVAPGLVGAGVPWWDDLADSSGGMTESTRRRCLEELGGRDRAIRARYLRDQPPGVNQASCRIAQEATLHRLRSHPHVTVGAHSWTHANLCRVRDDQLREELETPGAWLRQNFPVQYRPWLAFPYGLFTTQVDTAAKQAGYSSTLAIRGGWFRRDAPPSVLPRLNIPAGLSIRGLSVRLNGYLT